MSAGQFERALSLLRGLQAGGVEHLVVSPGSRSTPVILAARHVSGLRLHTALDERAGTFFALGHAKVTGRPAAVVCTSGSAGAHALPAVIEAAASRTPLVVLTADRPPELQGIGANQTIDQVHLFGRHARGYFDVGLFDDAEALDLGRVGLRAALRSRHPVAGAVQVNVRARKPLEPTAAEMQRALDERPAALPRVCVPRRVPADADVRALVDLMAGTPRGLIVAGPLPSGQAQLRETLAVVRNRTGYPLLAEATSQLRFGLAANPALVQADGFDHFLECAQLCRRMVILQIGDAPTSNGYQRFLERSPQAALVVIGGKGWVDPHNRADWIIDVDPVEMLQALSARLPELLPDGEDRRAWSGLVRRANHRVWQTVSEALEADPELSEARAVRAAVEATPDHGLLVVGNSLVVRHLDRFCPASPRQLTVVSQRGASGIDGLVAGAAGAAEAHGGPATLLLGDVSLAHDLGGLEQARRIQGAALAIVALDNRGGRIFEQLPIVDKQDSATLERLFVMPPSIDFVTAAGSYGVQGETVSTEEAVRAAVAAAHARRGCSLIVVRVPPSGASRLSQRLKRAFEQIGDDDD